MKRIFNVLMLATAATACETHLRAPICQSGEMHLPEGTAGHYRITLAQSSAALSGSMTDLEDMDFLLAETPDGYKVSSMKKIPFLAKSARKTTSDDNGQAVPFSPVLGVCKIGEVYYSQTANDDGTFSLSRLDISATGLTTTTIVFDPKLLKDHQFTSYFVPNLSEIAADFSWSFDYSEASRLIIDNSNLTEARREELLSLGKATAMGIVLSRVQNPKPFKGRPAVSMTFKRGR